MTDTFEPQGTSDPGGVPESNPVILPILPMRGTVVFPDEIVPLVVGREGSLKVIDATQSGDKVIGIITQKDPSIENPTPEDLFDVGTTALVVKSIRMPDGSYRSVVHGLSRFRIIEYTSTSPFFQARVQPILPDDSQNVTIAALMVNLRALFQKVVELAPYLSEESASHIQTIEKPDRLADAMSAVINVNTTERQNLLECFDLKARLEMLTLLLTKELQILELGSKIQSRVAGEIGKSQREYFLREQLKAIQKELGESDERDSEIRELREKMESLRLPEEVEKEAERELKRMSRMAPESAEHTVARTYLDWILELPWNTRTEDALDLRRAREILDEDHHSLQKVKKRILEFLAVRQLKPDTHGPIQCLVGPPGVGKTSLGRSIARALGRKFIRISLGGMHDEAEIRGHRRTYIGALPGKIIQELKKAGSRNPVFMLDEIDKLGRDFRGDPASALLEVLDPEQNRNFVDHYLNVPFDLSEVLFIATANVLDTIPPPLLDRMETMELPGYTEEEKLAIAQLHLVPKQLKEHGLVAGRLEITDDSLRAIINAYTREAGVRNLEREIAKICRGTASAIVEGTLQSEIVDKDKLTHYLGQPKHYSEVAERTLITGVATGLAYTPYGGDILFIEATRMKGRGQLLLTGKLGEVMKESAQTALSFLKSKADEIGIDKELFRSSDIHIHVPAGAVPKDGPSAGVTLYTALMSLFTGRRVRNDVAMTGEITLRGLVLPIGGVKEKILAAKRAGVHEVILPERNRKDVEEITEKEIHQLHFHYVTWMDEIPPLALITAPATVPVSDPRPIAES
jgi:ATP-dependent Lon protease